MPRVDSCAEAIYNYIRDYWKLHGQAPTHHEIQRGTGHTDSQINRRIFVLEAHGYITRRLGRPRSLEITGKPLPPAETRKPHFDGWL